MNEQTNPAYIKVSTDLKPRLPDLNRGKVGLVFLYMMLNQDANGIVPVGQRRIMTHTGIKGCDTIEAALAHLKGVGMAQLVDPDPLTGEHRMKLLGDFSCFGPGAPRWEADTHTPEIGETPAQTPESGAPGIPPTPEIGALLQDPAAFVIQVGAGFFFKGAPETGEGDADSTPEIGAARTNIVVLYEQNIGMLSPLVGEKLADLVESYGEEWVKQAIEIAVERNARRLSYITGILQRASESGVPPKPPLPQQNGKQASRVRGAATSQREELTADQEQAMEDEIDRALGVRGRENGNGNPNQ
jgi:DnaD/phage-associated family protein